MFQVSGLRCEGMLYVFSVDIYDSLLSALCSSLSALYSHLSCRVRAHARGGEFRHSLVVGGGAHLKGDPPEVHVADQVVHIPV